MVDAIFHVDIDTKSFEQQLQEHLDDKAKQIAAQIRKDARASAAFIDKSGRLRKSIKSRKSKFDDGGYIVKAGGRGAMQAFLIEHGRGPGGWHNGSVPAKPYLRPALDRNIDLARQKFSEKIGGI